MTRPPRRAVSLGLVAALAGVFALPPQAQAATATTLYVDNLSTACTDSGSGTQAAPYCTIQAAANAAVAGDTVLITGSEEEPYDTGEKTVTVAHSGTAAAPIVFEAASGPNFGLGFNTTLSVTGSYIEFVHGYFGGITSGATVTGSHVTFDHDVISSDENALNVGANVSGLTVERSSLEVWSTGSDVKLASGDSGTVLTTDTFSTAVSGSSSPEISVSSDTNTEIVSNTFETNCSAGVSVAASTGTTVENNIVASVGACSFGTADELVVDKASSASTTEGYNVLGAESGMTPYEWAGAAYSTQASFATASGQGAQDVVDASFDLGTSASTEDSDAHASANASAPGELSTDMHGNAWPSSTPDRGAIAFEELTSATLYAQDVTPQQIAVTLDLQGVAWGENDTVTIDWGDGSTDSNFNLSPGMQTNFSDIENYHMYAQIGTYTVTVTMQDDAQKIVRTATLATAGSTYVPVTPTRVLDTRHGTGAPTAKVASEGTLPVNVVNGVTLPSGIGTITAVVMNVTVTNPTAGGNISAYPGGTARPTTSNLNFGTGETVPNLVTVRVGAGDVVDLHNDSPGSTDLVADVEGYYVASTAGSYYLAYPPQRILDTRNDTGGVQGPVAANGTVSISVPQCTSGSGAAAQTATATAVALNVTVTDPTSNGHITVYPGATDLPNSSNLNFSAKETVPNLVVAKVGSNGKVNLTDVGSGTAQLVVDLEGCYSATLGDAFVPINPVRVLDSRSGLGQYSAQGQAAQPDQTVAWSQEDIAPFPLNASNGASAVVMNVTVTQPKAAGNIIAYPYGATRPTTSNLNFTPGETVPNLVMVPFYAGWQNSLYNNSKGTSELIADYYGYFG